MKNTTRSFAVSAMIAAAAGYLTGVLTAPKSGRETRQDIKEGVTISINETERQLKRLHTELNDVIAQAKDHGERVQGKAKEELDIATQATRQVKEMVREILSAVHDGRAEDKELQKAIADAQKAVTHLRSYIKKKHQ